MKIPIINTDTALEGPLSDVFDRVNQLGADSAEDHQQLPAFEPVFIRNGAKAIEYINYQMPPLILLNFSDPGLEGFEVMAHINADPWMNHGGIIALYEGSETFERINGLRDTNIITHIHHTYVANQLATVLGVIRSNNQILFQRTIQSDLVSTLTGQFVLELDLLLIPCYANLISNFLFNVGFVDAESKNPVTLVLTELLTNAIEHGNCEISWAEKSQYLAQHPSIHGLIEAKSKLPHIRDRRVRFNYDIRRERSICVISDDGNGFNWREFLDEQREFDYMAEHGRGIMLSRMNVCSIVYNDAGNEVTVEFAHAAGQSAQIPGAFRGNEIVECQPGDVIFRQGEESDFLYYVAEGEFHVKVNNHHVANITPSDVLMGEMSFLLEEQRSATVIAGTAGKMIKISKQDFIAILKDQPYYGLFLAKLIAKRLQNLHKVVPSQWLA